MHKNNRKGFKPLKISPSTCSCFDSFQYLQVLAIGPECDIALLSVEDEQFWKGVEPLCFGSLPRLQVISCHKRTHLQSVLWK